MAHLKAGKSIEAGRQLLRDNLRYEIPYPTLVEAEEQCNGDIIKAVMNGFCIGFLQGYKAAKAKLKTAK